MVDMIERQFNESGAALHFIQSKKFKTLNIVAKFKAPLEKDTITKRALLPYVLKQGTKNHPTRQQLQLKLDELYGAVLSVAGSKKGDSHTISIRLEAANQKFIPDETSVIDELIGLFDEFLFEPNAKNNAFDKTVFEREKATLKQKIHAIKDNKMAYANMRLIDEMCGDEAYGLHIQGYEDDLDALSAVDLYEYYQHMLAGDQLDIYVLGDFEESAIHDKISNLLSRHNYQHKPEQKKTEEEEKQVIEPKEIIERQDIQQAKLHIGYRTHTTYQDEDYFALQVFNGLFGGFPSSKLFLNVREKHSLAYYAASRFESYKGLLFVMSGIAPEDFEQARDIIREQLSAIKQGDFTEEELTEIKDLIVNQLLEITDNPQGIIEMQYQQVLGDKERDASQVIDHIQAVTREEVIQLANKIEEDTLYLLTSEGGMENA